MPLRFICDFCNREAQTVADMPFEPPVAYSVLGGGEKTKTINFSYSYSKKRDAVVVTCGLCWPYFRDGVLE